MRSSPPPPSRVFWFLSLALAVWLAPAAHAEDPWQVLRGMYPGVREHHVDGCRAYVYGADMTPGLTPEAAAAEFISAHGRVFGVGELEIEEIWRKPTVDGRLVVFSYQQKRRGVAVDGSQIRVMVRTGEVPRVRFATVRLADTPTVGAENPVIPAELAAMVVQAHCGECTIEQNPARVILRGSRHRADAWCWRVEVSDKSSAFPSVHTYYIDTLYGNIVHIRNHQLGYSNDVTPGVVLGQGTRVADLLPYGPTATQLEWRGMPGLRVNADASGPQTHVFTNSNGAFDVALGTLNDPIDFDAALGDTSLEGGNWFRVLDYADGILPTGEPLWGGDSGLVGQPIVFQLSSSGLEEHRVAQMDAVTTAYRSRAFARTHIDPTFHPPGVDFSIRVNYLHEFTCFAWAQGQHGQSFGLIIFVASFIPNGCYNTASHSIVAHEYGHVVLWNLGYQIADEFHEGYADAFATLVNDDNVHGPHQLFNGDPLRGDPSSTAINCQYPITGSQQNPNVCGCDEAHAAGQILSGVWVRIRIRLKAELGATEGLESSRNLFGAWTLITGGPDGQCNSAHPGTAIEVAEIAEAMGIDLDYICDAFAEHSISCP